MSEPWGNDRLLDLQEDSWSRGKFLPVEEIIAGKSFDENDKEVVIQLIWNEKRLREGLDEQTAPVYLCNEFIRRFPSLAQEIMMQFEFESLLQSMPNRAPHWTTMSAELHEADEAHTSFREGTQLPGYRDVREHARGAFGVVYWAIDIETDRPVAIKMLREGRGDLFQQDRLRTEAQRIAKLRHDNIVPIYECDSHDSRTFFTMPFIDGGSLQEHLQEFIGQPKKSAELLASIANAMHAANSVGIFHCDLKPSNILMDRGKPMVSDFGLAAMAVHFVDTGTRTETAAMSLSNLTGMGGTPEYMAPEQWTPDGRGPTAQTDVYGLGALLYHLLAGQPPGTRTGWSPPPPLAHARRTVPPDLAAICAKCMSESPVERYNSASDVVDDLRLFLANRPVSARPLLGIRGHVERFAKWSKRETWKAILLSSLVIVFSAGIGRELVFSRQIRAKNVELTAALSDAKLQRDSAATATFDLASLSAERASQAKAAQIYERALELFKELSARNPSDATYALQLARTKNNLAMSLDKIGQTDRSQSLLVEADRELTDFRGPPHLVSLAKKDLADVTSNRGNIFLRNGDVQQARDQYLRSEEIRKQLAAEHPEEITLQIAVVKSQIDAANLLSRLGGSEVEAIDRFEQVIQRLQPLVKAHPEVIEIQEKLAIATNNLGLLCDETGRPDEADRVHAEAVSRWQEILSRDPNVVPFRKFYAAALNNLGRRYIARKKYNEAWDLLTGAAREFRQTLQNEPNSTTTRGHFACCLGNLADCLYRARNAHPDFQKGESVQAICLESLQLFREARDEDRQNVENLEGEINSHQILGTFLVATNDVASALKEFNQAKVLCDELSSNSFAVRQLRLEIINNLAIIYLEMGQFDLAEELTSKGLTEGRQLLQTKSKRVALAGTISSLFNVRGNLFLIKSQGSDETQRTDFLHRSADSFCEAIKHARSASESTGRQIEIADSLELRLLYARRATVYQLLGNFDLALADWNEVLRGDVSQLPQHGDYRIRRAGVMAQLGDYIRASDEVSRLEPSPDNGDAFYNIACVYSLAYGCARKDARIASEQQTKLLSEFLAKAMQSLSRANDGGAFQTDQQLKSLDDEKDFMAIRHTPEFEQFIKRIAQR